MPIFEYACLACGNPRFSRLVGVVADAAADAASAPTCPRCGSAVLKKLVSRFGRVRSDDDQMERLADTADEINADDPRAVRRLLHDMAGSMDEEVSANDLEQIMDEADGGGDGAAIEAPLPLPRHP